MELQIPHPPPPLPSSSICSTSLATHKYTIPQKPQKQSIPVKWETTQKTQNNDAQKLKIRINNGSEQEQQQQSRKQSSAIFLIRVLQKRWIIFFMWWQATRADWFIHDAAAELLLLLAPFMNPFLQVSTAARIHSTAFWICMQPQGTSEWRRRRRRRIRKGFALRGFIVCRRIERPFEGWICVHAIPFSKNPPKTLSRV